MLAAATLTLLAIAPAALAAHETYTIVMTDYKFTPSHMTWHVGDTVTIKLVNHSTDKTHGIMFGEGAHFVDHNMKGTIDIVD